MSNPSARSPFSQRVLHRLPMTAGEVQYLMGLGFLTPETAARIPTQEVWVPTPCVPRQGPTTASDRVVPLPPWIAREIRQMHPSPRTAAPGPAKAHTLRPARGKAQVFGHALLHGLLNHQTCNQKIDLSGLMSCHNMQHPDVTRDCPFGLQPSRLVGRVLSPPPLWILCGHRWHPSGLQHMMACSPCVWIISHRH